MALSVKDIRNIINKRKGESFAFDLTQENPTEVKEWISTGSLLLDSVIARDSEENKGIRAGIPAGKVVELAGLEATGKSFMAAIIAAQAQKQGFIVVYFESEMAIDPLFWASLGVDVGEVIYTQAQTVEFVFETIEQLLSSTGKEQKFFFIWDSLPFTPTQSQSDNDFNPNAEVGKKPRVVSLAMSKILMPLANRNSTLVVINQLKTNIPRNQFDYEAKSEPYFTPGGKSLNYAYSVRLWLTRRKGKSSFIYNDEGEKLGASVDCLVKKSRFGTEGRSVEFKIRWRGDVIGIADEESWFDYLRSKKVLTSAGPWWKLDGYDKSFYQKDWAESLQDEAFRARVLQALDKELGIGYGISTAEREEGDENEGA